MTKVLWTREKGAGVDFSQDDPLERAREGRAFPEPIEGLPAHIQPELALSRVSSEDSYISSSYLENPDDLVRRKTLAVYETMGHDDQVHSTLTLKRHARLATGHEILPASDDPLHQEQASFIRQNFEWVKGSFDQKLYEIMSALQYGFSLSELLFFMVSMGRWKGKVGLKDLKTKSPFGFRFILDDYGNIVRNGLIQFPYFSGATLMDLDRYGIPLEKFVHFPYNSQFQNPYGLSDLRAAYRSWFSKDFTIKFMNIYIERHSVPPVIFPIPDNLDPKEIETLKRFAKGWQTQTSGTVPAGVVPVIPEGKFGGAISFPFDKIILLHNVMISRAILVPDLLGFSSISKGGSTGLGKRQTELFFLVLDKLGKDLEEMVIGEQIIKPLIDLNWYGTTQYPKFRFKTLSGQDSESRTRIIQMLVASGVLDPTEKWIRSYLDFPLESMPRSKDEIFRSLDRLFCEEGIKLRTMVCGFCNEPVRDRFVLDRTCNVPFHESCIEYTERCPDHRCPSVGLRLINLTEKGKQSIEKWVPTKASKTTFIMERSFGDEDYESSDFRETRISVNRKLEIPANATRRPVTFAEKRFPVRKLQQLIDEIETKAKKRAKEIFTKIKKDLRPRIRPIVTKGNLRAIDRIKIDPGPFKRLLNSISTTMALNGQSFAIAELESAMKDREFSDEVETGEDILEFVDVGFKVLNDLTPPSEGNRRMRSRSVEIGGQTIRPSLPKSLMEFFDRRAFQKAGVEVSRIAEGITEILEIWTERGDARAAEIAFDEFFEEWVESVSEDKIGGRRTNVIVSTALMEAYNQGRLKFFESPEVADFIVAYQWSSIIDRRTTPYCITMDQRVFRKEELKGWFPPAHWLCRSIVTPVLQGDKFRFTRVDPRMPSSGIERRDGFCESHGGEVWSLYTEEEHLRIMGDVEDE